MTSRSTETAATETAATETAATETAATETAGAEHRVATHLGVEAAAYDVQIRRFIPGYDAMIAQVIEILDETLPPGGALVVDLGSGTGALAGAILDAIPRARVALVDIDPNMLAVAAARVAAHGARAELRRATFDAALGELPACGAIVASLALHHVPALDAKRALYGRIRAALAPGGAFLSADAAVHEAGPERARAFRAWAAGMARAGIGAAEADALFAQWAGEDRYYPLAVELAALAEAGFQRPECFWRQGPLAVFGGFAA